MRFIFRSPANDLSDVCKSFTVTQKANKLAKYMKEYLFVVRMERETKAIENIFSGRAHVI